MNKWEKIYTKQIVQLDSKNTAIIITIELVMNNIYREFPKKNVLIVMAVIIFYYNKN